MSTDRLTLSADDDRLVFASETARTGRDRAGRRSAAVRPVSGGRQRRYRQALRAILTMAGVGAMAITLAGLSRTLWGQPQIRYPGAPQVVPYNNGPQGGYQNPGYGGGVPNNGLGGGPSAGDGYPRMAGLPASPVAGGPAAAVDANGNPLGTDGQPVPAEAPAAGVIPMSNVVKVLRDGGPMMFPILICSFILTIFVFERFVSLRRSRVIPRPFVKRFLQRIRENDLDADEAIKLCDANKSPIALVFSAAAKRWDRSTMEVEQAILDEGEQVTNTLRKYSRLFNGISTVCPLMGLLGTVLGMIESFNTIAASSAMGRPELLAGGIGQAMLTTAAGLSVAIPALIVHLYFSGRVDKLTMEIDGLGQDLTGLIASDGWERNQSSGSARRKRAA